MQQKLLYYSIKDVILIFHSFKVLNPVMHEEVMSSLDERTRLLLQQEAKKKNLSMVWQTFVHEIKLSLKLPEDYFGIWIKNMHL